MTTPIGKGFRSLNLTLRKARARSHQPAVANARYCIKCQAAQEHNLLAPQLAGSSAHQRP